MNFFRILKIIPLARLLRSLMKYSTLGEKFRISRRPCTQSLSQEEKPPKDISIVGKLKLIKNVI